MHLGGKYKFSLFSRQGLVLSLEVTHASLLNLWSFQQRTPHDSRGKGRKPANREGLCVECFAHLFYLKSVQPAFAIGMSWSFMGQGKLMEVRDFLTGGQGIYVLKLLHYWQIHLSPGPGSTLAEVGVARNGSHMVATWRSHGGRLRARNLRPCHPHQHTCLLPSTVGTDISLTGAGWGVCVGESVCNFSKQELSHCTWAVRVNPLSHSLVERSQKLLNPFGQT